MQPIMTARSRFDGRLLAVMDQLLEEGRKITDAPWGNLQLINWRTGCLEIVAEYGFELDFLTYFQRVNAADNTCCGRALQARCQTISADVEADVIFPQDARIVILNAGVRSCQSTPLISRGGAFVGVLSTHFPTVHCPSVHEMERLRALASTASFEILRQIACQRTIDGSMKSSREALASSGELLRKLANLPSQKPGNHR